MSDPQYGTQILRFVETAQVAKDEEIEQFCACIDVRRGGAKKTNLPLIKTRGLPMDTLTVDFTLPSTKIEIYGVTQQSLGRVNSVDNPSEQNASENLRLVSVATSGLLLIEQDFRKGSNLYNSPLQSGDPLSVTSRGKASKNNYGSEAGESSYSRLVTINGATPVVRSVVDYGRKHYALVYFP